ncbi:RNA helicase protein [Dioscorea alata]|uniref:RNA helicase protein n=1 Tax=Dioscorea alata TaxID=55571 RepID=A0ACB7VBL3_DIOAL|nr:RNA helicase protein [Dioscorea alata]
MAPKKKSQHQHQKSGSRSAPKSAPKLQISAENESRLRRLLLNTQRPAPAPPPPAETESKAQKGKRLRGVYDKLSLEGFTEDQIERALSALSEGATFENALDWLCLNIPGNELPLKFSSGGSTSAPEGAARSIKVLSTARADWVPQQRPQSYVPEELPGVSVRVKGQGDELSLELGKSGQADWIRQYMEQEQEEESSQEEEDVDLDSRAASIVKEYHHARSEALLAKQRGDKKNRDYYGAIINKLKQEMSSLGLSHDILLSELQEQDSNSTSADMSNKSIPCEPFESKQMDDCSWSDLTQPDNEPIVTTDLDENFYSDERVCAASLFENDTSEKVSQENEEPVDLELDNLFSEDHSSSGALPHGILKQQKKEKLPQLMYGGTLLIIDDIWKKGDLGMIPKALLQKLCQRLGWKAPKYAKLSEKDGQFLYSMSILRTAVGRGKSHMAGGLITLRLPDQCEPFGSVEDAQNKVAAFALSRLFPDLPLSQMVSEPYSSFVTKWEENILPTDLEESEHNRRSGFVDSLLRDAHQPMVSLDATLEFEKSLDTCNVKQADGNSYPETASLDRTGEFNHQNIESVFLEKELKNKIKLPKYKEMMKARATLPIANLKNQILHLLKENDVIVISGETGCGKTTQVPQFILDDMIGSGQGGFCNIVCTQPRRIAAISVAERVSNERCEPSPGSDGSVVGFQVRLDSARNEMTKLLFCTTGILLRKLAGDKYLTGISHVIVDEVHERTLLGDFLLIVLRHLIQRRKLKVILMSATVDATMFSRYFGNCPVICAEGRTFPVSTYFLEDVYETLNYSLPSDSPASGKLMDSTRAKDVASSVGHHRGKRNIVLSSWGDESLLMEEYVNPCYVPGSYESYSERTRQNLKNLKEDVIDYDLLEDLISYIDDNHPPGAILVFLPGVGEINSLIDRLTASFQFGGIASDWILPLHSSLSSADQRKVFLSPPENIRKVIIATDIAETSITIDDVTYVVDTGKHKENRYNPQKKMTSMFEDWISQANAKQRRGRAGRVKPGVCFCLYTRHRFESLMRLFQVPEMSRMPLTELCLQIKSLSLGCIKSFLMEAIEPPHEEAISSAIDLLYKVGAFEGDEELSPLGYHLAKLPVDVLIGKMVLYGSIFGCVSPILSIAAFLSYKFPFIYPKDEKQNVERAKSMLLGDNADNKNALQQSSTQSDHLLLAVAYDKWAKILYQNGAKAAYQFCRSFFLNSSVMHMIRDMRIQFGSLLADIGLIKFPKLLLADEKRKDKLDSWLADLSQPFNIYSCHPSIIKSIICAGLYPNVAATLEGTNGTVLGSNKSLSRNLPMKDQVIWFDGTREVHIHPSSINHSVKGFHHPFLVFP